MNKMQIVAQLQIDEGFAPQSFWDNDQWTWGYGTKADGPGKFITKDRALPLLIDRAQLAIDDFYDVFAGCVMSEKREHVFVNLLFNIGKTKLLKFKNTLAAVREQDWGHVAFGLVNSLWYKQVPKRAGRLVLEVLEG